MREYFGRGAAGQSAAEKRDKELGLKKTRPARKKEKNGFTFGELAKEYYLNKNFSENSKKQLMIRLEANILPFFGNKTAIRITDQDMDNYVKHRRSCKVRRLANIADRRRKKKKDADGKPIEKKVKTTLAPVKYSTINRELTDIKAILNWSTNRHPKLIPYNPVANYKKPKPDYQKINPPTLAETRAIMEAAADHLKRFIKLSFYLGARPGAMEILSITWDRVDLENKTVLIESAHKGGPEWRSVPIHDEIFSDLESWKEQDGGRGPVVHYRGKPIRDIQSAWELALARAGIKRNIRPYDLRHNWITTALAGGANLKAVAEVAGSRPETIMRFYQHVTTEVHQQAMSKIPKLDLEKE